MAKSNACRTCPGFCCYRFTLPFVKIKPNGKPDWVEARKAFADRPAELAEIDKIRRIFYTTVIDDDPDIKDGKAGMGSYWPVDGKLTVFACRWFRHGKCQHYDKRPKLCRIHLCDSAVRYGRASQKEFCIQARLMKKEGIGLKGSMTLRDEWRLNYVANVRRRFVRLLQDRFYRLAGFDGVEEVLADLTSSFTVAATGTEELDETGKYKEEGGSGGSPDVEYPGRTVCGS